MTKIKKTIKILTIFFLFAPLFSYGAAWDVSSLTGFGLSDAPISGSGGIVAVVLNWLLGLFGTLGVIGFVVSGFQYLTAAGDENQVENAKRTMKYSIIGIVVGISGYVILLTISNLLEGFSFF